MKSEQRRLRARVTGKNEQVTIINKQIYIICWGAAAL
jgi:hypothetical protein